MVERRFRFHPITIIALVGDADQSGKGFCPD